MNGSNLTADTAGSTRRVIGNRARRSLLPSSLSVSALLTIMAPIMASHGLHVGVGQAGNSDGGTPDQGTGDAPPPAAPDQ